MTNKEAIKILKRGYPDINRYAPSELEAYEYDIEIYNEAIKVAIKSLEDSSHIIDALEKLNDDTINGLIKLGIEKSIDCIKNLRRKDT